MAAIAGATLAMIVGLSATHAHGADILEMAATGSLQETGALPSAAAAIISGSGPSEPLVYYEGFASPEDAPPPVRGSLDWMLQPVTSKEFFSTYWEKRVLHVARPHMNIYADEVATNLSNVHAMLAVQKSVEFEPILSDPGADPPRSQADCQWVNHGFMETVGAPQDHFAAYLHGNTIICHLIQGYWSPVANLVKKLEDSDGFSWGANLYLTPRGTGGFKAHTDNKNGFILQVAGRKRWTMHDTAYRNPMRDQQAGRPWNTQNVEDIQRGLLYNGTLGPGDVLYVPRGVIHSAETYDDGASMHFTISTVMNPEWADFLGHFLNHFPSQDLDATELPAVPGMDGNQVVQAVQMQVGGLLSQAVANERAAPGNAFLRASVPFIKAGQDTAAQRESVLAALDEVLLELKATVESRLVQLIESGQVNGAVLSASFAALLGQNQAKGTQRRRKALELTLQEYIQFVDYVERLNAAGRDRKPPCKLLAAAAEDKDEDDAERIWDGPRPGTRIRFVVTDLELTELDPTKESRGEPNLELKWKSGSKNGRWQVRKTEALATSLRALVAASQRFPNAFVQPMELAGGDDFERLSLLMVLRQHGVLAPWTDPCAAGQRVEL